MLKRLRQDHKNISVLVNILAINLSRLEEGLAVNYQAMGEVVEYMQSYAEHSHHPVEDIIYEFMLLKMPQLGYSAQLANEHLALSQATEALNTSLKHILADIPVTTSRLQAQLQSYIALQRQHMQFEEQQVFPLLSVHLDESDWEMLADQCQTQLIDDPLFRDDGRRQCLALSREARREQRQTA